MRLARNQVSALTILAEATEPLAGIEIAERIGGLGRSSIYAALAALQRDGLVGAQWDVSGQRPRRLFHITALGEQALAVARQQPAALRLSPAT